MRLFLTTGPLVCLIAVVTGCGSSTPTSSPSPSRNGRCGQTESDIPFVTQLTLPTDLPKDLRLVNACSSGAVESTYQTAELFYSGGTAMLIVVAIKDPEVVPVQPKGRETIRLGDLVGYASDDAEPDGTIFYGVEFEKDGRAYAVGASLGPTNDVTRDDVNAVALSIAEN